MYFTLRRDPQGEQSTHAHIMHTALLNSVTSILNPKDPKQAVLFVQRQDRNLKGSKQGAAGSGQHKRQKQNVNRQTKNKC